MDVVAYCRYSSEAQRDGYSIEAQVRAIKEWAAREGHTVRHFYIDEAKSGTSDNREEFQKMIADAATCTFQAVVVHKLDRFARDRYDSAVYRHKLKEHGVRVVSVLEPLDDSPESVMMEAVLEGMAEYYSRNLSREVRKGQKEAALKGQHTAGLVPYGFALDKDNHYIIVPEEAAVIREIFRKLDAGESIADVARWCVAKGLKTRRGNPIDSYTISRLTANTLLVGRYSFGVNGKHGEPPVVVENAVEPIVDPDVFWRQYNRMQSRQLGPRSRHKEEDYLLTGYLFCEHCGRHLYGFKSKSQYDRKDGKQFYVKHMYRCSTKGARATPAQRLAPGYVAPKCPLRSIEKNALEDFVIGAIHEVLFSGKTLDWFTAEMLVRAGKRKPVNNEKIATYKAELEKLAKQKERLLDLYLTEGITKPVFASKTHELERREEFIAAELQRLTPGVPVALTADDVKKSLDEFLNSPNADSPEYKKRLLATFVERITVSNERIVIYFKFPIPGAGDSVEKTRSKDFVRKGAKSPILVTPSPIVILVKPPHSSNA